MATPGYDWTWDDVISMAKKVHNPSGDVYGLRLPAITLLRDDASVREIPWVKEGKPNWTSSEMMGLAKWWEDNVLPMSPPVFKANPWLAGEVAFSETGVARALAPAEIGFDWVVRPWPKPTRNSQSLGMNLTNTLLVNAASKNKDEAADVLRYFTSDEGYFIFADKGLVAPFGATGRALDLVLAPLDGAPYDSIAKTILHAERNVSSPIEDWTFEVFNIIVQNREAVDAGELKIADLLELLQSEHEDILAKMK